MYNSILALFLFVISASWSLGAGADTIDADDDSSAAEEVPVVEEESYSVNTFYALLVAEMAGQRQLYDLALGNYLLEAHRTQDPGVTARAASIAQYIGADQAALDAATLWVKLDSSDPAAQLSLSQELIKASRFSESILHLQQALDLQPDINLNFIAQEGAHMTEGARELWLESLIPLTATYTKHEGLLFSVATLHQQQANNQAALDTINSLLKLNDRFYPAWTMKARLQAALGDNNSALSTIDNALTHFDNDKSLILLKARLHIKKKEIHLARDAFLMLSKEHHHDAQVLLPLALTQLELGEHKEAKTTLQKLLNLHQLNDEAHYYLGRIEQHDGNDEAALQHYLAMKSGREYLAAQNSVVKIHLKQGRIEQAVEHIRQQRVSDPQNQQAYFLMEVEILNRTGQFEESIKVLNSALTAYADDTDLRYSRAMVSEKLGNLDQLEKDLGYIIDRDPENATALNALGYTLADRTARLEEALKLIEKARNIAPSDPAIIDSLGWVYFRMGRLQEALTLLKQAYEAFPDPEVAAHLGEVLWILGKHDQAKEIWQQGLQKKPNSQIIRDTLDRLQVQL